MELSTDEQVITINNLNKSFANNNVLKNLDFNVIQGTVIGLLGKNGAGKTTLLQILVGLIKAQSEACQIFSHDSWNLNGIVKQKLGYVAQESDLIPWMKVDDIISYTKSFYQHWNSNRVATLLDIWELHPKKQIGNLSVGQKQKLSIILAVGHEPDLLILDEPVASLDPIARRQFLKQLIEMNSDLGKTILFSTHIVSDIERVAAEVMILKDGQNYFQGDLDTLKEKIGRLHIHSTKPLPENLNLPGVLSIKQTENSMSAIIENLNSINTDELCNSLNADVRIESMGLEDIFLEVHA